MWRVATEGNSNEVAAFIQNPKIWDSVLVGLYERKGLFADMPEARWQHLIWMSASNARLVTEYEYHDMPDMGRYDIHKSIFGLLETAPVNYHWVRTLIHLLDQLDFQLLHNAERIDHVLTRWAQLPISEEKDSSEQGVFTKLPIRDEFRAS